VSDSELAQTAEPQSFEVCFSPEEPCGTKLVKFVLGAKKSLDLAVYDINLDQLVHHVALASKRMPVRVIVDQRQSKGEYSLVTTLIKAGVDVRYGRQRGVMHNKFIIRDGAMIETGSFNFTNHATMANNENQIYLDKPEVVARYQKRFEEIWVKARPAAGPAVVEGAPSTGQTSPQGAPLKTDPVKMDSMKTDSVKMDLEPGEE
jgi:phosphatidylserine/phosphatidylglycerophosphate/cardiolipin synthase-like enzyme